MIEGRINLYSDTQTRPSSAMRHVMAEAIVGDEQHLNDPSVTQLCDRVAALLGKQAAVFLPSGTMCNEIAMAVHCRAGDEIFAHESSHIIHFEGGGPAALAGATVTGLSGERGMYSAETLAASVANVSRYKPKPRLVAVEQTSNLGGGAIWSLEALEAVAAVARTHDLALHMDGARLMNASVAAKVPAAEMAAPFDSVWIDLSKGLGCPMGGVLAGTHDFIDEAWRWKQRIGGSMRQAGFAAAAGLYALDHNVDRLAQDHANAAAFAGAVDGIGGLRVMHPPVETNLVFMDVAPTGVSAQELSAALEVQGINIGAMGATRLRAVTHLDVSSDDCAEAAAALTALLV